MELSLLDSFLNCPALLLSLIEIDKNQTCDCLKVPLLCSITRPQNIDEFSNHICMISTVLEHSDKLNSEMKVQSVPETVPVLHCVLLPENDLIWIDHLCVVCSLL